MTLRLLRYFVAVAEELHLARAADRLGIEQSPVSRAMRDLERLLGVSLFDRSARQTRLTWAGQVLLGEARRVLATVDQAVQATKAAAQGYGIGFAIGAQVQTWQRPDIAIRPLAGITPTLTTYLLRRQSEPSEPTKRFVQRARELFQPQGDAHAP